MCNGFSIKIGFFEDNSFLQYLTCSSIGKHETILSISLFSRIFSVFKNVVKGKIFLKDFQFIEFSFFVDP